MEVSMVFFITIFIILFTSSSSALAEDITCDGISINISAGGGADQLFDRVPVKLTYLSAEAVKHGAVCLDGSPGAYHFDNGFGQGADKWIVHLQGGALCYDTETCLLRSNYSFGSSKFMTSVPFTGIISRNKYHNPYFHDWNRVFVRYCDGGLYTGDRYDPVHKLHYKGAIIFKAVVDELLNKGLGNATNVVLHGCSAGGQAAILFCDKFRSFLPAHINVKCVSDAGYFIHTKDVLGEYNFVKSYIEGCAKLHGSIKNLPKACTSTMEPKSLCLFPQYVIPHVKTPLFIINSALDHVQISFVFTPPVKKLPHSWEKCGQHLRTCSAEQIKILKGFRLAFLRALPRGNGTFRGIYITSCDVHCRDNCEPKKSWSPKMRLEQNELIKALGDWTVFGSPYQKIDHLDVPQVCT